MKVPAIPVLALFLASAAVPGAERLRVEHEPATCVPQDRHLRLSARALPRGGAVSGELQFHARADAPWYGAAMHEEAGEWVAELPRAEKALGSFEYRVVLTSAEGGRAATAPLPVRVVADAGSCAGAARSSLSSTIVVRVPPGAPLVPPVPAGFSPAGVVAAQEREARRTNKLPVLLGSAGVAGLVGAVAATKSAAVVEPAGPDIPTFSFNNITPTPGTVISASRTTVTVFVLMSHEPTLPVDFDWRFELRTTVDPTQPACASMGGHVQGAQRPLSLVLSGPLQVSPACGQRFQTSHVRLTIFAGPAVTDTYHALPFEVEP